MVQYGSSSDEEGIPEEKAMRRQVRKVTKQKDLLISFGTQASKECALSLTIDNAKERCKQFIQTLTGKSYKEVYEAWLTRIYPYLRLEDEYGIPIFSNEEKPAGNPPRTSLRVTPKNANLSETWSVQAADFGKCNESEIERLNRKLFDLPYFYKPSSLFDPYERVTLPEHPDDKIFFISGDSGW